MAYLYLCLLTKGRLFCLALENSDLEGKGASHGAGPGPGSHMGDSRIRCIPLQKGRERDPLQSPAQYRWHEFVRRVIQANRNEKYHGKPPRPYPASDRFFHLVCPLATHIRTAVKLQEMRVSSQELSHESEHLMGMIRSLRFSPDGKYLLASNMRYVRGSLQLSGY